MKINPFSPYIYTTFDKRAGFYEIYLREMMKHAVLSLMIVFLFTGCDKKEDKPPDHDSVTGTFAITEIGLAGHWRISKLNESNWDFELFGDTIKFGGFAYGASTTINGNLIAYAGWSLKQVDLEKGILINDVPVEAVMFGLESPDRGGFVFAMTGETFSNCKFSEINIETGEIKKLSQIQINSTLSACPSAYLETENSSAYFIYGKTDSHKIFCFDATTGTLLNAIPVPGEFPLHRIDGLEYDKNMGLIYYIENKEDGKWKLMTLNPVSYQKELFIDDIELFYNINAIVLDEVNQYYFIQNHSSNIDTVLTVIDLNTKQINIHSNSKRIIELNQL